MNLLNQVLENQRQIMRRLEGGEADVPPVAITSPIASLEELLAFEQKMRSNEELAQLVSRPTYTAEIIWRVGSYRTFLLKKWFRAIKRVFPISSI